MWWQAAIIVGLTIIGAYAVVFAFYLARTPFVQRDEARAAYRKVSDELAAERAGKQS